MSTGSTHDDAPEPKTVSVRPGSLAVPRSITLADAIDLDGFRRACRALWAEQVEPGRIAWHTAEDAEGDLFDIAASRDAAATAGAPPVHVPPTFMALCESVILHRDENRFGLLYRLLWRLQTEPGLRHDPLDADWVLAQHMAQAVRHDMYTMQASVHFRVIDEGEGRMPLHVAWFEPEHHIVEATAPFFARRSSAMRWAIATPERSVHWDGERLLFSAGARREDAPPADAGEQLWLAYYRSIVQRSVAMVQRDPIDPPRRTARPPPSAGHDETPGGDAPQSLAALREALERCRECPIGEHATRAVPGEGLKHAPLMFVGEQPGDQEDLQGKPFVGPAGQLFSRALAELGIERRAVYVTNAVKHFKFELRGKRRIHKTPAQQEAAACLHWLESEIGLVDPTAIVALGATAARQLMGAAVAVTKSRGQWMTRADGRRVLITLHPSALLRMEPADKDAAYAAWLADLRHAAETLKPGKAP